MKPFNLEAALAGAPVVTRDGRKVDEVIAFKTTDVDYPVSAKIGQLVIALTTAGQYWNDRGENELDLFMAPKKHKVWLNLYPHDSPANSIIGYTHASREDADRIKGSGCIACIEIEFEEGQGL